ncbi:MAG: glycosyl transferase, family [Aeromicrobium sp.]|nr:glycosyl transferase, family [Aeromicrobium sp.]
MRIVYLHQYYRTPEQSGGTRSYEMARRFAAAGHEVHVITTHAPTRRGWPSWESHRVGDVEVHALPVAYDNTMGFARRLLAFAQFAVCAGGRAGRLRPDVILASSTPLTVAIPAAVAKWRSRAPVVFEVRDLWPKVPIAIGVLRNPALRWLAHRLERFAYRISSDVVALSDGMADGVAEAGVSRDRIHVIPNSCDNDVFDVPAEEGETYRRSLPWLGQDPLVVYCGTLGRINGVGWLARLAAATRRAGSDVQYLVVGPGAEEDAIREEAAALGVLDVNFHMLPPVPKTSIPAIMSAATVSCSLVVPIAELEANSANKFFDSLAAGRPTFVNHGGWQADVLRESGAGIDLPWHDVEAAAGELIELVGDDARLEDARVAARRLARGEFDRDRLADQLLGVLERAVGAGPAADGRH